MSEEKSEAVVVRGVDFSESSKIVTFITPRFGRLTCIAKGVRRKNSRFSGVLETFNHVELVFHRKESREVQTLAEASLVHPFSGIKKDFEKTAYAAYSLEFAGKCANDNEPSEHLFATLLKGLYNMDDWSDSLVWHSDWHILALLGAVGLAPELHQCIHSGKAVSGACRFSWDGGVCATQPSDAPLSAAALDDLRLLQSALQHCPPSPEDNTKEDTATVIFKLLRHYASHHLEKDFRSIRVIEQLLHN